MRKILTPAVLSVAFLGVASVFGTSAAHAQEYPWCAEYGGRQGGTNCGFTSWRQCMAAVSGNGGYCTENRFFRGPTERFTGSRPARSPYASSY